MVLPLNLNTGKKSPSQPVSSISALSRGGASGSNKPSTSIYRAQHDSEEATTSIYRAQHAGQNQPSTSIAHVNDRSHVSAAHTYEEEQEADDLRYDYIRRVIKARKRKEAAREQRLAKQESAHHQDGIELGKGKFFRKKQLHKQIYKHLHENTRVGQRISAKEQKEFEDTIAQKSRLKKAGAGFSTKERKKMKVDLRKKRKGGDITAWQERQLRDFIDKMQ